MANNTETQDNMPMIFTFGDPENVLSHTYPGYLYPELLDNGTYYESQIDLNGLASLLGVNSQHGPIIYSKKELLSVCFEPTQYLSFNDFEGAALDYGVFGQCYFQVFRNGFGKVTRLKHHRRMTIRKSSKEPDVFYKITNNYRSVLGVIPFKPGEIIEVKEPDVMQGIYGRPSYLGGEQSLLLSEDSTLMRRRWYLNGTHMGFILLAQDANMKPDDEKKLEAACKEAKGLGNGRNLFVAIDRKSNQKGNLDALKILPIGDIGSKDNIEQIRALTNTDALAMHNIFAEMVGLIPDRNTNFGDRQKAFEVYHNTYGKARRKKFLGLNDQLGVEAVVFSEPDWNKA